MAAKKKKPNELFVTWAGQGPLDGARATIEAVKHYFFFPIKSAGFCYYYKLRESSVRTDVPNTEENRAVFDFVKIMTREQMLQMQKDEEPS